MYMPYGGVVSHKPFTYHTHQSILDFLAALGIYTYIASTLDSIKLPYLHLLYSETEEKRKCNLRAALVLQIIDALYSIQSVITCIFVSPFCAYQLLP